MNIKELPTEVIVNILSMLRRQDLGPVREIDRKFKLIADEHFGLEFTQSMRIASSTVMDKRLNKASAQAYEHKFRIFTEVAADLKKLCQNYPSWRIKPFQVACLSKDPTFIAAYFDSFILKPAQIRETIRIGSFEVIKYFFETKKIQPCYDEYRTIAEAKDKNVIEYVYARIKSHNEFKFTNLLILALEKGNSTYFNHFNIENHLKTILRIHENQLTILKSGNIELMNKILSEPMFLNDEVMNATIASGNTEAIKVMENHFEKNHRSFKFYQVVSSEIKENFIENCKTVDDVQYLEAKGVDFDVEDLYMAARVGKLDIVEYLYTCIENHNTQIQAESESDGGTNDNTAIDLNRALNEAAACGSCRVMSFFQGKGAQLSKETLYEVVASGIPHAVEWTMKQMQKQQLQFEIDEETITALADLSLDDISGESIAITKMLETPYNPPNSPRHS